MNQVMTKPQPQVTGQVLTTTRYELFKPVDGNRLLNLLHLKRLLKSMEERCLFTVIIVNERKEIIDGQHRFECLKQLGHPINYIICKGYGLNEVHRFNANSKTWTADDYLSGYCDMNYPDYIKYRTFKDEYQFGHNECMSLLSGTASGGHIKTFFAGEFKIKNYKEACTNAEKIIGIQPYYAGFKRRTFVLTLLGLFKNKNFDFEHFMSKLKIQPTAMQDCVSADDYRTMIEKIYNHRSREKTNLRY